MTSWEHVTIRGNKLLYTKRNLTISPGVFVIGIGGGRLAFAITRDVQFELAGVPLATVVGNSLD